MRPAPAASDRRIPPTPWTCADRRGSRTQQSEAGLQELQISIDGVTPDHVSNWSVIVSQTGRGAKHALLRSRLPP
jgi:hypothetical protein